MSQAADGGAVGERLASIRRRLAQACARAGRHADEVTLVGASKRQPIERMTAACAAGLLDFGENHVQEAEAKRAALPAAVRWHLLGPLQSNKARRAAEIFDVVHALDRLKIGRLLDREAARLERRLDCFLEVNLAGEPSKHGFAPEQLEEACATLLAFTHLKILGLMAIPPPGTVAEDSRPWFAELRALRDRLRASHPELPGALSMGMSGDFEVAVEEGATHVRIGTELFGPRPEGSLEDLGDC